MLNKLNHEFFLNYKIHIEMILVKCSLNFWPEVLSFLIFDNTLTISISTNNYFEIL